MAVWAVQDDDAHRRVPVPADLDPESTPDAVRPLERPSWPMTAAIGAQQLLATATATVVIPLLAGFSPAASLLCSGVGTLVVLLATRGRVPIGVGPSIAVVAPLVAARTEGLSAGAALGGVVVVGIVVIAVGVGVKALGARMLHGLVPPLVAASVLVLAGGGVLAGAGREIRSQPLVAGVAGVVLVLVLLLRPAKPAMLAVLAATVAGWLIAVPLGGLDPDRVAAVHAAPWLGFPVMIGPTITPSLVLPVLPVAAVIVVDVIAATQAAASVCRTDLTGGAGDALVGVGVATVLAGATGVPGATARIETAGVIAASRVASTAPLALAGAAAAVLACSPKAAAWLTTMPTGVVGTLTAAFGALIAATGLGGWARHAKAADPVGLVVVGITLLIVVAGPRLPLGDVALPSVTWGVVVIILLHPLLRGARRLVGQNPAAPAATKPPAPAHQDIMIAPPHPAHRFGTDAP